MDSGYCARRTGFYNQDGGFPPCKNESCREKEPNPEMYFDIYNLSIADATGQMKKLRLANNFAIEALQVTVKLHRKFQSAMT